MGSRDLDGAIVAALVHDYDRIGHTNLAAERPEKPIYIPLLVIGGDDNCKCWFGVHSRVTWEQRS